MNFISEQLLPEQRRLLFAFDKNDPYTSNKIGYLRGDFGKDGNEFYSTWFDSNVQLKCSHFKEILDELICKALRLEAVQHSFSRSMPVIT